MNATDAMCRQLGFVPAIVHDEPTVADAQALKLKAEMQIKDIIEQFERETGCNVVDVSHWKNEFSNGLEWVKLTVML